MRGWPSPSSPPATPTSHHHSVGLFQEVGTPRPWGRLQLGSAQGRRLGDPHVSTRPTPTEASVIGAGGQRRGSLRRKDSKLGPGSGGRTQLSVSRPAALVLRPEAGVRVPVSRGCGDICAPGPEGRGLSRIPTSHCPSPWSGVGSGTPGARTALHSSLRHAQPDARGRAVLRVQPRPRKVPHAHPQGTTQGSVTRLADACSAPTGLREGWRGHRRVWPLAGRGRTGRLDGRREGPVLQPRRPETPDAGSGPPLPPAGAGRSLESSRRQAVSTSCPSFYFGAVPRGRPAQHRERSQGEPGAMGAWPGLDRDPGVHSPASAQSPAPDSAAVTLRVARAPGPATRRLERVAVRTQNLARPGAPWRGRRRADLEPAGEGRWGSRGGRGRDP